MQIKLCSLSVPVLESQYGYKDFRLVQTPSIANKDRIRAPETNDAKYELVEAQNILSESILAASKMYLTMN